MRRAFHAFLARVGVSIGFGGPAVYIILAGTYDAATVAWATGIIGVIIGYWLR